MKKEMDNATLNNRMNAGHLAPGIYFFRIVSEDQTHLTGKIIKEWGKNFLLLMVYRHDFSLPDQAFVLNITLHTHV